MIPKVIKRRIRPLWIAGLAGAAWANREDLNRWLRFARRAIDQRKTRPLADVVTEARVRAAVSADPLLRRDPALKDLSVHNGVVTLITTSPTWPDPVTQVRHLLTVKGISEVTSSHL